LAQHQILPRIAVVLKKNAIFAPSIIKNLIFILQLQNRV